MNDLIAEIAVENTTYSFDRIFDYEIPNDLSIVVDKLREIYG